MRKPMSDALHASLEEQPLLLSISRDPSSAPKITKCLLILLLKNTKVKEEKGFLCREVKQATPPGYWPGSLAVEQCVCSCITPLGYCLGLLASKKHQRWKLILWKSSTRELNYPSWIRNIEIQTEIVIVFDWVGKGWTMYVHGVSRETEITCTSIQYSPKDKALC